MDITLEQSFHTKCLIHSHHDIMLVIIIFCGEGNEAILGVRMT